MLLLARCAIVNAKLETEVIERKLSEKKLLEAFTEAEAANKAKSEFLSSMSHELRTSLNSIMGFGRLLEFDLEEPLSDLQLEYTQYILKGGQQLIDLIDQVLDLSKIEAGISSLSFENVIAANVIDEYLKMVQERALTNDVSLIDQTTETDLSVFWTDKARFRQILLNFLSNAIKYKRPGGSVTITSEFSKKGFQRFRVIDTGQGIPKVKKDELFEPFNRLGKESGGIEGTGIGLTITKQLAELLGARFGFESEEAVGSTFWIEIPISDDQSLLSNVKEDKVSGSVKPQEISHNKTRSLLYIEDNPANMNLMSAVIDMIDNLTLYCAPDAETGLDMARSQIPDLILMDINLPGMDGVKALKKLHSDNRTKNIPVVALTTAAMPDEIQRGKAAGFEEYFTKPINVQEVLKAINTHIS